MKKVFLVVVVVVSIVLSVNAQTEYKISCVAFYNLENLFDTIVDPDTNRILQDDFTPDGNKLWNTKKYYKKLDNMARVISEIGTEKVPTGPAILGVSEIENRLVLEDLVKRPAIASRNYQIVHFESPDERGIDVALLYQPDVFEVTKSSSHSILLPNNNRTRAVLLVEGLFYGEKMYFMVDHWPSRGGGQKKSNPLRDSVASHDRGIIDSILAIDPDAKITIMGDFNDDPIDESVEVFLNANGKQRKLKEGQLFNPMYKKFKKGIGSLAYNDAWNLFDQIVITQSFLGDDYSSFKFWNVNIFNKKYLVQQSGHYKGYPFRTYGGGEYQGGYSDHFPVYMYILKENN